MGCCCSLILYPSPNEPEWRTQQNQTSNSKTGTHPVQDEQALESLNEPFPGSPKSLSEPPEPAEEQDLESFKDPLHNSLQLKSLPSEQVGKLCDSKSWTQQRQTINPETILALDKQTRDAFPWTQQSLSDTAEPFEDQALENLKDPFIGSTQTQSVPTKPTREPIIENLKNLHLESPQYQSLPTEPIEEQIIDNFKDLNLVSPKPQPLPTEPIKEQVIENLKNLHLDSTQFRSLPTEPIEEQVIENLKSLHLDSPQSQSVPTEPIGKQVIERLKNLRLESPESQSLPTEPIEEQVVINLKNLHLDSPQCQSVPTEPIGEQVIENLKVLHLDSPQSQTVLTKPNEKQVSGSPEQNKKIISDHGGQQLEHSWKVPTVIATIVKNDTLEVINLFPDSDENQLQQEQQQEQQIQKENTPLPTFHSSGSIPDAPSYAPSVTEVTSSAATLSWYGSSYDGGSQVTGYNIEAKKLPEDTWVTLVNGCHSTSYKTKDLENGSEYQFRVCAVNVHGVSEPSKPSDPITIQEQVNHKNNNNSTDDYEEKFPPFELKKVSIEPADTFNEEYDLSGELGRGRFGVVYKVKHKKTGQTRAAKVIKCIRAADKQGVRDEIDLMNSLRHPRLLQIAAAYERKRDIVMVLELISGGELFDRVIADDFDLTEKDCIFFMRQICEGLEYMHDNKILHLDLKPENILCVHKNSNHIKLIDFGLSRRFDPDKSMQVLHGTPEFIAPEVINYDPISYTSDMWSVGVICYVLLTGLSPFMGDTDAETLANITNGDYDFDDESFDDITQNAKDFITALLLKKKEDRLTATNCLKHKWLNQKEDSTTKVVLSTDKLKKFTLKRKWQKTGLAIKALGRIASLTSCTSPSASPVPSNYPPVSSPPSSPLPTSAPSTPLPAPTSSSPPLPATSSSSPIPVTSSSLPSITTVSSPISPTPVLYTSRTVINLAPVAVNSIPEPVKD